MIFGEFIKKEKGKKNAMEIDKSIIEKWNQSWHLLIASTWYWIRGDFAQIKILQ